MLLNTLIGALMIIATTGIHAEGMRWSMHFISLRGAHGDLESQRKRIYVIGGVVLIMFLVSVAEVAL